MKKLILALLLFSLPLCANSKAYHLHIQKNLDKIITSVDSNVHVGVLVTSAEKGLILYEKNADQLFIPASTAKIFTAGAALSQLGPEYTFETRLLTDGKIKRKILEGNLYIQGSGDPSLTLQDLEALVLQLRLSQVTEIDGDLIVDNFAFDEFAKGPGWMWDDFNGKSFCQMNALSVNHNLIHIWVQPSTAIATAPKVFAYPKTGFITIENCAITDEKKETLSVERMLGKNTIRVKGEIGVKSALKCYEIPLKGPHLYAGTLLKTALQKAGITCKGKIKIRKTPVQAEELTVHKSQPLATLLKTMLKDSDNLYADNFFKVLGSIYAREQGSWKNGSMAVKAHLEKEAGLPLQDMVLLDGSGISRYNLVSPRILTNYLLWAHNSSPFSHEFLSALSLAGRDGTLKKRFCSGTPLRGKTGTMSGVTTLCGFVDTQEGETLAFTVMASGFTEKTARYKHELEDQIVLFLSGLSRD